MINWITNDIKNPPEHFFSYWNTDRSTGIYRFHPTNQAIGWMHGYGTNCIIAKMYCYLTNQGFFFSLFANTFNVDCVIKSWQNTVFKTHIDHGSHDLNDLSFVHLILRKFQYLYRRQPFRASAPFTISINSLVIYACRALL